MPSDPFYSSRLWRELRAKFLAAHPGCSVPGCPRPSGHVDHIRTRSSGGPPLAWGNLQAFCLAHGNEKTARSDRPAYQASKAPLRARGCDAQGWPLSPEHPWATKRHT